MNSIFQKGAIGIALVTAGMLAGGAIPFAKPAHGEIRTGPPPQAFQSGGQLSVPVLKEIASTLHQIDSRLARLETVVAKLQTPRTASPNAN